MVWRLGSPGIRSIVRKELLQLFRDRYLMAFIITLPILQLMVTGIAVQRDLRHIPTVVCNYDHRNASRDLLRAFGASTYFDLDPRMEVDSEDRVQALIKEGRFRVGIIIPPDYSERVLGGEDPAAVQMVVDGTNANIAKIILEAARMVVTNVAFQTVDAQRLRPGGEGPPIGLQTKVLYNPDLKTSYFLIPAILSVIMHMMTILFTSFAIVRERETGTLEQLMVTPLPVRDLMVGKVLPYAVIGLLDMLLTVGVMVWFFNIEITGSLWFLLMASVIFILTSLGVGLLISITCQTQVQAIQLTLGLLLPSLFLTGFVFPLEPMPLVVRWLSQTMPLTHYLEIIRGVTIKGAGLPELWQPTLILLILGGVLLGASIFGFRKRMA